MNRTVRRVVAALSLFAVVAVVSAAPANAADPQNGVGSTGGAERAITIDLGDLLHATIVGESNATSTDTSIAPPNASQQFLALAAQAPTPPLDVAAGQQQTSTTGTADQQTTAPVDLGTETALVPGLLDGTIDAATLRSIVDAAGANSTLDAGLTDVQ